MTVRERIDDFLAQKRIAFAGASRDEKHFSRALLREFVRRGYDVIPVNPAAGEIEGLKCFPRVVDIAPAPDAVLVLTAAKASEAVVEDCARAGVTRIWLYRATGEGAVSEPAIDLCESHSISVIPGYCPFMFLPATQWLHRVHGFFMRLTGSYPK